MDMPVSGVVSQDSILKEVLNDSTSSDGIMGGVKALITA